MGDEELRERIEKFKAAPIEEKKVKEYKRPEVDDVEAIYRHTAPVPPTIVKDESKEEGKFLWTERVMVIGADQHLAARGSNLTRFIKSIEWCLGTENAFFVSLGDLFNNGIKPGQHNDIVGNQAIIRYVAEKMMPLVLQGKLAVMVDGNHDGIDNASRDIQSQLSPMAQLVDKLTPYDSQTGKFSYDAVPHAAFSMVKKFAFRAPGAKDGMTLYTVDFTHGSGKGGTPAGSLDIESVKAEANLKQLGIDADAIVFGHYHANTNCLKVTKKIIEDERGYPTHQILKQTLVISAATLQEDAEYAKMFGFPPADSNVNLVVLKAVKNPNKGKNGDQRDYIIDHKIMELFKKDSNEFTADAKEYMENRPEPDIQAMRREVKGMTRPEIEAELRGLMNYKPSVETPKTPVKDSIPANSATALQKDAGMEK